MGRSVCALRPGRDERRWRGSESWSAGANGDIGQGDFISSSGTPGIGMRQDGDCFMCYTIAQARESIHFESPSDIHLVACYYHCG
ncbi:hypothetical protein ACU4GD_28190 [Cupriavidus basilensis]